MKFMKFILTSLAVSCVFTATAFAAELSSDYNYTFNVEVTPTTVNAGETIDVSVYVSATDNSGNPIDSLEIPADDSASFAVGLDYNKDVLSITPSRDTVVTDTYLNRPDRASTLKDSTITTVYGDVYGEDLDVMTPDTVLVKYTFTVSDNALTATYDSSNPLITIRQDLTTITNTTKAQKMEKRTTVACPTVNVVGTAPAGPTVDKGDTVDGITEYTVSTLENKKVMMSQKFENKIITEATRFVVTYNGKTRYFGSDLYEKLLNGGQNNGSITIESLTFGLIVDGTATADQFTFDLR